MMLDAASLCPSVDILDSMRRNEQFFFFEKKIFLTYVDGYSSLHPKI